MSRAVYLLLLSTRALGDVCTSPGLTVPSFAAYIGSSGAESCVSLYNNACPSAAGVTAPVVALDPFLFMGWPARSFAAEHLTSDGQHLNDAARALFCDVSQYANLYNRPVRGKWVFQTSMMQMFCELGYSVNNALTVDQHEAIAQGPYGGRGAQLRSLATAGAVGVTSFNFNFTLVERNEAETCYGVSTMPVTYTNTTHYHSRRGTSSVFLAAHRANGMGLTYNIRIPSAPAPSPPPPPARPPAPALVTIATVGGAAFAGAILVSSVVCVVVRRRKKARGSVGSGAGGKPPQPQQQTNLYA